MWKLSLTSAWGTLAKSPTLLRWSPTADISSGIVSALDQALRALGSHRTVRIGATYERLGSKMLGPALIGMTGLRCRGDAEPVNATIWV